VLIGLFLTLVFLLALTVSGPGSAGVITGDGTWEWTNPSVQGNTLKAVSFIDANHGWAAGVAGTVLKTNDGGANWIAQIPSPNNCAGITPYGNGCNLSGISFIDANNGWAVGEYGTIWHTTNGGSSWSGQTLPSPLTYATLTSVHFFNSTNGLAVGSGYSFGTVNGGATWTQITGINTANYNNDLASVRMIDANTAFAVGEGGAVYRITQAGGFWSATQQALSGGIPITSTNLQSVYFTDATHGFAAGGIAGSGRILRTTDGANWSVSTSTLAFAPWGVTVSGNTLVICGSTGSIYKRNAATNWTDPIDTVVAGLASVTTSSNSFLMAVAFPGGSSTGYVAGTAGTILKTIDTGNTWTSAAGGNDKSFNGTSFISDTTGWMVASDHSIVKTTDAGGTWVSDNAGIPSGINLKSVSFINESTGYAVGNLSGTGKAYKYNSGTWSEIALPAGISQLWGVHLIDATHGWMVGFPGTGAPSGVALKTTDGSTWAYDASGLGTNIQLYSVDTSSATSVWAVGQNRTTGKGIVAHYVSGAWAITEKTDSTTLISIDMVNGTTGYIAGYGPGTGGQWADGKAYKTIDGSTWNAMTVNFIGSTVHSIMDTVSFVNSTTGYLAGGEGRIFKTVNGTDWTVESAGTAMTVNTISAIPSVRTSSGYAAFAGGAGGGILRSPANIHINQAPVLSAIGNRSIDEGSLLTFTASATDPDLDTVTYSASGLPAGANLDPNTGVFTWTPDYAQSGTYEGITITASDNGVPIATDSETITITVANVNRAPVLATIGDKSVDEGILLTYTALATDPDLDTITYSASGLPAGANLDPNTGIFTWTPDYTQAGIYGGITITASDNGSPVMTDSETITITVANVNYGNKPNLTLHDTSVYWGSFADYQDRTLTAEYAMENLDDTPASEVSLTDARANSGVICQSAIPIAIGVIAPHSSAPFTLQYTIPDGLTRFRADFNATAQNIYGTTFVYP